MSNCRDQGPFVIAHIQYIKISFELKPFTTVQAYFVINSNNKNTFLTHPSMIGQLNP